MVAGIGNKCVKYIFWLINFLFFLLGALVVGVAAAIRIDPSILARLATSIRLNISSLPIDQLYIILYGAMFIGALMLILGFLGCCGAACESLCVVGLYFVIVCVLVVVEIAAVVLYFVKKSQIQEGVYSLIRYQLVNQYYTSQPARDLMDAIQSSLQCCGSYGCTDYGVAPSSCYCQYNPSQIGCSIVAWQLVEKNVIIVLVVLGIILLVEMMSLVFTCVICGAVKDKRSQNY